MNHKVIDKAFTEALAQKVFSGAQVTVGKGEDILYQDCFGALSYESGARKVSESSLFDVASLTKPLVTTVLAMKLTNGSLLGLSDSVSRYLPNFNRPEVITVRDLLAHRSGLSAWLPLFEQVDARNMSYGEIRDNFIRQICHSPLEADPGTGRLYSDLGFILLGFVLERASGRRLEELFQEHIVDPLNLRRSFFKPRFGPARIPPDEIAATEESSWRKHLLVGEVHDDNAHALGGVAGHAGLFSTASDLQKVVRELRRVQKGNSDWIFQKVLLDFIGEETSQKLGWDTVLSKNSQAGKYFSSRTIGHLAFTGCSLWIDPADQKYVILLTNRVHPSRDNEKIKEFRPRIHDLILETLGLV